MSIHTTKFRDYLINYEKEKLHPKLSKIIDNMSQNISELNNLILYGPPGIGKYTMSLRIIKNFSDSKLKYEKKICVESNNSKYFIKGVKDAFVYPLFDSFGEVKKMVGLNKNK